MSDSKARENNLWSWMRKVESKLDSRRLHWRRVENSVGYGDSDVEGCCDSTCFCVELKSVPRAEIIKTGLEGHQAQWLQCRMRAGGNAYVFVQVGSDVDACRYLIPAAHAHLLCEPILESTMKGLSLSTPDCNPVEVLLILKINRASKE